MATKKSFLPKDYKAPVGDSSYMKLEEGKNRVRILSEARIGWEGWKDGKPFRREGIEQNIEADEVDDNKLTGKPDIRHFWAFLVYDYADENIKILEISQKTIQRQIEALVNDPEWGDPENYDIGIERVEGKKVSYNVSPFPPKKMDSDIQDKLEETQLDIDTMFAEGDDDQSGFKDFKGHMKDEPRGGKRR